MWLIDGLYNLPYNMILNEIINFDFGQSNYNKEVNI